jgi:hypothetical protein
VLAHGENEFTFLKLSDVEPVGVILPPAVELLPVVMRYAPALIGEAEGVIDGVTVLVGVIDGVGVIVGVTEIVA